MFSTERMSASGASSVFSGWFSSDTDNRPVAKKVRRWLDKHDKKIAAVAGVGIGATLVYLNGPRVGVPLIGAGMLAKKYFGSQIPSQIHAVIRQIEREDTFTGKLAMVTVIGSLWKLLGWQLAAIGTGFVLHDGLQMYVDSRRKSTIARAQAAQQVEIEQERQEPKERDPAKELRHRLRHSLRIHYQWLCKQAERGADVTDIKEFVENNRHRQIEHLISEDKLQMLTERFLNKACTIDEAVAVYRVWVTEPSLCGDFDAALEKSKQSVQSEYSDCVKYFDYAKLRAKYMELGVHGEHASRLAKNQPLREYFDKVVQSCSDGRAPRILDRLLFCHLQQCVRYGDSLWCNNSLTDSGYINCGVISGYGNLGVDDATLKTASRKRLHELISDEKMADLLKHILSTPTAERDVKAMLVLLATDPTLDVDGARQKVADNTWLGERID